MCSVFCATGRGPVSYARRAGNSFTGRRRMSAATCGVIGSKALYLVRCQCHLVLQVRGLCSRLEWPWSQNG
jgi:hypothetical protein